MRELGEKVAVVTGAASGMGRAFAERFARAGMKVVLADVEAPRLEEAVAAIRDGGGEAAGHLTDVSDADAVDGLRDAALERFGAVHVVCNNAGVGGSMLAGRRIELNDWRWVMDVNFWGVVHGHRTFLPVLLEQGEGHIVNTASMAGLFPGHSAYSASKWAVVGISEGLRGQLQAQGSGVGISCLCPGFVATNIMASVRNRPEWAAPSALAAEVEPTEEERFVQTFMQESIDAGMPPHEVAELVHDAVVADRFWIFTDTDMVASLRPRLEALLAGEDPPVRSFGG